MGENNPVTASDIQFNTYLSYFCSAQVAKISLSNMRALSNIYKCLEMFKHEDTGETCLRTKIKRPEITDYPKSTSGYVDWYLIETPNSVHFITEKTLNDRFLPLDSVNWAVGDFVRESDENNGYFAIDQLAITDTQTVIVQINGEWLTEDLIEGTQLLYGDEVPLANASCGIQRDLSHITGKVISMTLLDRDVIYHLEFDDPFGLVGHPVMATLAQSVFEGAVTVEIPEVTDEFLQSVISRYEYTRTAERHIQSTLYTHLGDKFYGSCAVSNAPLSATKETASMRARECLRIAEEYHRKNAILDAELAGKDTYEAPQAESPMQEAIKEAVAQMSKILYGAEPDLKHDRVSLLTQRVELLENIANNGNLYYKG